MILKETSFFGLTAGLQFICQGDGLYFVKRSALTRTEVDLNSDETHQGQFKCSHDGLPTSWGDVLHRVERSGLDKNWSGCHLDNRVIGTHLLLNVDWRSFGWTTRVNSFVMMSDALSTLGIRRSVLDKDWSGPSFVTITSPGTMLLL